MRTDLCCLGLHCLLSDCEVLHHLVCLSFEGGTSPDNTVLGQVYNISLSKVDLSDSANELGQPLVVHTVLR